MGRVAGLATGAQGAALILFHVLARPLRGRRCRWGATPGEVELALPGDELVTPVRWRSTRAVTVDAPPVRVWPWIAQLGQERGGFYSYEALENLVGCRVRTADHVHAEWQDLRVDDTIRLHPETPPLRAVVVEPPHHLVLLGGDPADRTGNVVALWAFHLLPVGTGTRLIERTAYRHGPGLAARLAGGPALLEPISFVMSRRMLLELRRLATFSAPPAATGT